jgi:hypothetical protein
MKELFFYCLITENILVITCFIGRYSDWLRPGRPRGWSSNPSRVKNFNYSMSPIQWVPGPLSPGIKRPGRARLQLVPPLIGWKLIFRLHFSLVDSSSFSLFSRHLKFEIFQGIVSSVIIFSLFSLFKKYKRSVMRSPCCALPQILLGNGSVNTFSRW